MKKINSIIIAKVPHGTTMAPGEPCTNARLITKAPEMFELVIALLGTMPPALQKKWPNIVKRAKDLIHYVEHPEK